MDVRVLGPLAATSDAGTAIALGGPKQRLLFAMLAVDAGTTVSRDRLIDAVWGDNLPADPVNTLQHYISRLRSLLAPAFGARDADVIERVELGYRLRLASGELDLERFRSGVEVGTAALRRGAADDARAALTEALGEWRGEALQDFRDADALQPEIARIDEEQLRAREELFEAELAAGLHAAVVAGLVEMVHRHPVRERLWAQLMLALYRSGRQAEALRAYQDARAHLGQVAGLGPGTALTELERRILDADPGLDVARPSTGGISTPLVERQALQRPPRPGTSFVGRRRAVADVERLLGEPGLVTMLGGGGVGKSRLSIEVARRLESRFERGACYVPLDSVADASDLNEAVSSALGVAGSGHDLVEAMNERLRDQRALLLLDGCDRVRDPVAELLARLDLAGRHITVLATSKVALGVGGERRYVLEPLTVNGSHHTPVDATDSAEAVTLFCERAALVQPGFAPSGADLDLVAGICETLDGNPLALELAAARLDILSLGQIHEELQRGIGVLDSPSPPRARTRSFSDVLLASLALLDSQERTVLERLAVFEGGFDLEAARAVVFADAAGDAAAHLGALVSKSVLRVEQGAPKGEPRRFTVPTGLLDVVRSSRPAAAAEIEARRRRHATWVAALAADADRGLRGPDHDRWLRRVDVEQRNVRAALGWSYGAGQHDVLAAITANMARYWDWRGQVAEATRWCAHVLESSDITPDRGWALVWSSYFEAEAGRLDAAEQHARAAIEAAGRDGDKTQVAAGHGNLGIVLRYKGELNAAAAEGERSVAAAAHAGDAWFTAWASTALGVTRLADGDAQRARDLGEASLDAFRRLGDRGAEAWALGVLALAALHEEDRVRADRLARHALLVGHLVGAPRTIVWALEILASTAVAADLPVDAVELLGAAEAVRRRAGVGSLLHSLGGREPAPDELLAALEPQDYEEAWRRGRMLDLEAVIGAAP